MDKYIGFNIDSKKTVACVAQKGNVITRMPQKNLATEILLFDFELFIGGRYSDQGFTLYVFC